ncbi:MAG: Lin0512 family protein [Hyphomicrobiaceae bacterium]|nr:Lin0512 family protein [Hyphomicrobiaceae bacterium]
MALKRLVLELGMGTDIRGADSTKAAKRALLDAIRRNSLSIAPALGKRPEDMRLVVRIGVPRPETVDTAAVLAVLPYGQATIEVVDGGLEIKNPTRSDSTLIAHAAVVVKLDVA